MSLTPAAQTRHECNLILQWLGRKAAHRVWDRLLRHRHDPDDLSELVSDECEVFRLQFEGAPVTASDVDIASDVFRAALIGEGKALALLFAANTGGSA